jgi:hypothetical protein
VRYDPKTEAERAFESGALAHMRGDDARARQLWREGREILKEAGLTLDDIDSQVEEMLRESLGR